MFKFNTANDLSLDEILNIVSDLDIFAFYIQNLKLKRAVSSPLRDDAKPSFTIFPIQNKFKTDTYQNKIHFLFMDFATGETGNCFTFVKKLLGGTMKEAVDHIHKHMIADLNLTENITRNKENQLLLDKYLETNQKNTEIDIIERKWNQQDIDYWGDYGITYKTLKLFKVIPTEIVYIKKTPRLTNVDKNPIYSFTQTLNPNRLKIYRPKAIDMKWLSNMKKEDILGIDGTKQTIEQKRSLLMDTTMKVNYIILTKGLKDVMTLHELQYPAIASQNESLISETIIEQAKELAHNVYIMFDNDEPGKNASKRTADKYNLKEIKLPPNKQDKDISDMYKQQGKIYTKDFLNSTLTLLQRT